MKTLVNLLVALIPVRKWRKRCRKRLLMTHVVASKYPLFQSGYRDLGKGRAEIEYEGIRLRGDAHELLFIANEVFVRHEYQFFKEDTPFTMIDVGCNIATTSLWFAANPMVKQIVAFEPFEPTYQQAVENLSINPQWSEKIQLEPFGLGGEDCELTVPYNPEKSGRMGVFSRATQKDSCEHEVTIEIRKASTVLGPIIRGTEERIFMKIDCEGSEFDILEDLDQEGLLGQVDVIVMEWHFQSPQPLIHRLNQNGFVVFLEEEKKDYVGLIRAVRMA
jgi:FkbM family methyltransferase